MSHQADNIAKMIEQKIDIKLRAHDREHPFEGTDEQFRASAQTSVVDQNELRAIRSSLKYEVVYHQRFAIFAEARTGIFHYIETFYNRTRLHSSLAYRSPIAFESQPNPTPPN